MKKLFSERHGYVKPSEVVLIADINIEVINAISTCFSKLEDSLDEEDERVDRAAPWLPYDRGSFYQLCLALWTDYLRRRQNTYGYVGDNNDAFQRILLDKNVAWFKKLDIIEFAIDYMESNYTDKERLEIKDKFIVDLNSSFEKLHYGYRIVNGIITDIITPSEVEEVETALDESEDVVSQHLNQALVLSSDKLDPDYRNSIKEAVTAVEALLRSETGESTFGKAYSELKKKVAIHPRLQEAIQKVYDYTNQEDTGIRHSKLKGDESAVPDASECRFMIITCSAIINYLSSKLADYKE